MIFVKVQGTKYVVELQPYFQNYFTFSKLCNQIFFEELSSIWIIYENNMPPWFYETCKNESLLSHFLIWRMIDRNHFFSIFLAFFDYFSPFTSGNHVSHFIIFIIVNKFLCCLLSQCLAWGSYNMAISRAYSSNWITDIFRSKFYFHGFFLSKGLRVKILVNIDFIRLRRLLLLNVSL